LFTLGNIALQSKRIISIVGTRHVTPQGLDFTRKLIADLAVLDPVIISGFAYGVDIVAHRAAIENGLQTCAVLGSGLTKIYPAVHKKYVREITSNGGLITEFWSKSEPERENFVKRNRIVAGMAEATVVIESAERGGSLITAQFASDYNREVFAVPGRASDTYSTGCNNLIKTQKAHLLTDAADLVYMMGWKLEAAPKQAIQKQLFVSLEPDEQTVFEYLNTNGKQLLDSIALHCKQPVYKLSATLLNMELKGVIRPLSGKLYEAI
jgi:DNA processing protein